MGAVLCALDARGAELLRCCIIFDPSLLTGIQLSYPRISNYIAIGCDRAEFAMRSPDAGIEDVDVDTVCGVGKIILAIWRDVHLINLLKGRAGVVLNSSLPLECRLLPYGKLSVARCAGVDLSLTQQDSWPLEVSIGCDYRKR